MERPSVICHMVMSIDGKVTGDFLFVPECERATEIYYRINRDYRADAFACGRVTMEDSFTGGWYPDLTEFEGASVSRTDYAADETARYFAVAFDRLGRLGWKSSRISDEDEGYDNAHIIEVLGEHVPDAYLAYLRSIGVSYIFAGEDGSDVPLALQKLRTLFGIEKLLLEGGSVINGAFARAGVVDELSLVTAPLLAGSTCKPLFDGGIMGEFALQRTEVYEDGVIWANYTRKAKG